MDARERHSPRGREAGAYRAGREHGAAAGAADRDARLRARGEGRDREPQDIELAVDVDGAFAGRFARPYGRTEL